MAWFEISLVLATLYSAIVNSFVAIILPEECSRLAWSLLGFFLVKHQTACAFV